jgi:hypothetical protein
MKEGIWTKIIRYSWVLILLSLVIGIVYYLTSCNSKPIANKIEYIKGNNSITLVKGDRDSIVKTGMPDTVIKYISYPIYIERPKPIQYGKDSSIYSVKNNNGTVEVTTYPVTDSIRIDIQPIIIEKQIKQIDTLLITQIDTLKIIRVDKIKETIVQSPEFYETWWFGSIITGLSATVIIILAK